jgi:hypothetical protein
MDMVHMPSIWVTITVLLSDITRTVLELSAAVLTVLLSDILGTILVFTAPFITMFV